MNRRTSPSLALVTVLRAAAGVLLAAIFTSGCQSPRTARIHENLELFQSLDPFSRKVIQEGLVNYGMGSALVIMALGQPNHISVVTTDDGVVETWTYRNYLYANPTVRLGIDPTPPSGGLTFPSSSHDSSNRGGAGFGQFQPTLTPMIDMPVGTLILELLDGSVVTIRIDP